jgi:hypothetical protein
MLTIWIVLLVAGLWALFTGSLPMVLFSGFGTHRVEGIPARVIGLCLALSAPVSFVSLGLSSLLGSDSSLYAFACGLGPTVLVMLAATIAVNRARTPYQLTGNPDSPVSPEVIKLDNSVRQKVQRSMYLLALGLGLALLAHPAVGVIVFPLAYIQATRAISLTDEQLVRNRYRADANVVRLLAVVLVIVSVLIVFAGGVTR